MDTYKDDINLAVKGDADAFARLYATIYKDLYKVALYSLRNEQDAQDAVSEAVLDAFAGVKKLRDEQAFKAWFFAILSAKIKKKQKEYANACDEYGQNEIISQTDFSKAEIKEAFEILGEEERLVLSLSALGGYKTREIAQMCKMNHSTVRSKISRAKEKLKNILYFEERSTL